MYKGAAAAKKLESNKLCPHCKNAVNGCNWSRDLEPVKGWTAEWDSQIESWHIKACPEYRYDDEPAKIKSRDGFIRLVTALAKEANKDLEGAKAIYYERGDISSYGRVRQIENFIEDWLHVPLSRITK